MRTCTATTYPNISIALCPSSLNQVWLNFTGKKLSDAAADSFMDLILSTDRKSASFDEVFSSPHPVFYNQISLLHKDQLEKEMKELQLDQKLRMHKYVELVFFRTFLVQQDVFPRKLKNPFSFVSVVRLACGNYQFPCKVVFVYFIFCCSFHLLRRF